MVPICTGWFGQHKFVARYDYGEPHVPEGGIPYSPAVDELGDILERMKSRTYVRDVCVRCGHIIERSK